MKKDLNSMSTEEKSQSVIRDYNDIASEYCDEFCCTEVYNVFIDKWLQLMKKGIILDVGCGGGNNCQYINEKEGFEAFGIDFSDGMIAEARKRYPNVKIFKMDMTNVTFPDQTFDGILSNCSLIHIPTELLSQTIRGFKRILKPNGKILLIVLEGDGEEMTEEPYREGQDVYAYTKLLQNEEIAEGEAINVVVPTGNFGNILAAYFAKHMGVPIDKLICASNENKVLFDFFQTGVYDKNREFILTNSPSMDILISSNLERLVYMIAGCDAEKNSELMKALKSEGVYSLTDDMKANLADFAAGYATEEEVRNTISEIYAATGYVIDTHTAVAAKVCKEYQKASNDTKKTVIASTASPYKFARSVMTAIDEKYDALEEFDLIGELEKVSCVSIPNAIEEIRNAEILHTRECDADKMEETVKAILGV